MNEVNVGDELKMDAPYTAHRFTGEMKVKVVSISIHKVATVRALTGNFGWTKNYADVPIEMLRK